MTRVYNFSAGPAALPEEVLQQVRDELLEWRESGMSVMEMSHRGEAFMSIAREAEQDLRDLLGVPDNYKVLFLQGGASTQFSAIPMNLLRGRESADYVLTGNWAKKAAKEAGKYCRVNVAASSEGRQFTEVPDFRGWNLDPDAAYVHITGNETIQGVEYHQRPDTGDVPLVADMSSHFLSRPVDVSRYGLIYAGAQKNVGPAGVTVVIVRDDLIGDAMPITPMTVDYAQQAEAGSMLNTPPCFNWYVCGLVFKWLKRQGGLEQMAEINRRKAQKLYDYIDSSDFYSNPVKKEYRSRMNVPFILADDSLNKAFLEQAEAEGLATLKGHRSVGGMRASIYNAMPESGVDALIHFMQQFAETHG